MATFDEAQFEQAPRPGMSGTTKLLLILGGVGGFCMLLCCGVFGYFAYQAKNAVSTDPAVITKTSQSIIEMDIPAKFKPQMSMDMLGVMKMAQYTAPNDGRLMLMGFGKLFNDPQQQEQMKQQMSQQHGSQGLKQLSSETREIEIGGKKIDFHFAEAENTGTHKKFKVITGAFPGKEGIAVLTWQIAEKDYDEEEAIKTLKSIH